MLPTTPCGYTPDALATIDHLYVDASAPLYSACASGAGADEAVSYPSKKMGLLRKVRLQRHEEQGLTRTSFVNFISIGVT
jgi:hypothetical protein